MKITVSHCRYTPHWETVQQMLQEATNNPRGKIIGIRREDGGCDYRKPGVYYVGFDQNNGTVLPVTLETKGKNSPPAKQIV